MLSLMSVSSCGDDYKDQTAGKEQARTEKNQARLNSVQPAPELTWSLERDQLIKRFYLMNDRSVTMFMYVFVPGSPSPIGYYQVYKVSSVDSQLTNPEQIIQNSSYESGSYSEISSPAEDGSYGTNGDGKFSFTPDGLYIEHNLLYMVATAPLNFREDVPMIGKISVEISNNLRAKLKEIENDYYGQ